MPLPSFNPDESRVLGVLIEKSTTTPEQYPLSLNALTNGCNQKNNRDPVRAMSEDECFDAVESLRAKTPPLVIRVDTPGSRVHKYRHNAGDVLHARGGELAILAELLLRGPQTVGELRGRAGRMSPMESIEITQGLLTAMMTREEPMVRELPPAPGSRANRFVQLLCPDLHPIDAPATAATTSSAPAVASAANPNLSDRVARLETEVAELRGSVQQLMEQLGVSRSAP
jgi:uncharacterized protein YceH (UPF0502 family)